MLRHTCRFKLAKDGHDTRSLLLQTMRNMSPLMPQRSRSFRQRVRPPHGHGKIGRY